MKITSKTISYYCDRHGSHYFEKGVRDHHLIGPAYVGEDYYREWCCQDSRGYFQKNGPGFIELNGGSGAYHIEAKPCSKEEYEDYCKDKKL